MVQIRSLRSPQILQLVLYSGIALVVVSMLFLNREFSASSFLVQAVLTLAAPAFFYLIGGLVLRYLNAPLAGPGIIATGAWLIGVSLIHLYDRRVLLPENLQPYYWLVASLIAVIIITRTGHRVRMWLIIPLVPLLQINAFWTVLSALRISLEWWTPLSFVLVVVWWELRLKQERWTQIYRVSATLFTVGLIVMSYTLRSATTGTIVATWATGALVVLILGMRQGWVNFGPLAIGMLFCATLWGINPLWWSPAWLALATMTILLMEQQSFQHQEHRFSVELSVALAVLLSGGAALYSVLAPAAAQLEPLMRALVLFEAGALLAGLGSRREITVAAHVGLWLIAAPGAQIYLVWFIGTQVFGVWLGLLASVALLIERLMSSMQKHKHKRLTLLSAVMHWPIADLSLGMTILMVIWTFWNVGSASPLLIAITTGVTVGIWLVAGLVYRLPALLYSALWIMPLPFALILMYLLPPLRQLPMIAFAWQMLGVGYVLLGHGLHQQRPAVRLPFFLSGYGLLNLPLVLTLRDPNPLPISLALPVLVSLSTAVLVLLDRHPAWTALVSGAINPDDRPFAWQNTLNLFMLHGAWTAVIWLHLTLNYTGLSFAQQGIVLVLLSTVFVTIGRLLPRIQGVGWHVYGAGWLMWFAGLIYVYPFPTEALMTVIMGLAISVESVYRSRELYWMPVLVLQLLFTALQLTKLLALPSELILMGLTSAVFVMGLYFQKDSKARIAAQSSALLIFAAWLLYPDLTTLASMLVMLGAVALRYRQPLLVFPIQMVLVIAALRWQVRWEWWQAAGILQYALGTVLMLRLRPPSTMTYLRSVRDVFDHATPYLWGGFFCIGMSLLRRQFTTLLPDLLLLSVLSAIFTTVSGLRNAPFVPVGFASLSLILAVLEPGMQSYRQEYQILPHWSLILAVSALGLQLVLRWLTGKPQLLDSVPRLKWWIDPLWQFQSLMGVLGIITVTLINVYYGRDLPVPVLSSTILIVWCGLSYQWKHQPRWLWMGLALTGMSWFFILNGMDIQSVMVYTLPGTVLLLMLARYVRPREEIALEYAAIAVLLLGCLWTTVMDGLNSPLMILSSAQIVGLMMYGYLARRQFLFTSGGLTLIGGGMLLLVKINFWFIPLMLGVGLMIAALGLEVARERLEGWLLWWNTYWSETGEKYAVRSVEEKLPGSHG